MAKLQYSVDDAIKLAGLDKDYRFIDLKTAREITQKWHDDVKPSAKDLKIIKDKNKENGTYADLREIRRVIKEFDPALVRKHVRVSASWLRAVKQGLVAEDDTFKSIDLADISLLHACQLTHVGLLEKSGELKNHKKTKNEYDPEVQYSREASSFLNNRMLVEDIDLILKVVDKAIAMRESGA